MTYGEVSKAPVIPYIDSIGAQGNYYISIIPDDVEDVTGSGRGLSIYGFGSGEEHPELAIFPHNDLYDEDGNLPTDSSHYENIWGKGGLQDNWVDDHIKNITSRKPQEMETYYEVEIPYTRDELISEEFFVEPKKKRVKRKGAKLI